MRIILILLIISIVSCKKNDKILELDVTNTAKIDRVDAPVHIDLKDFFRGSQLIANNLTLLNGNKKIESQFIDYDKDGQMDELFFHMDIKKKETKQLVLLYSEKGNKDNKTIQKANIRFGEKKAPYNEISSFDRVKTGDSKKASELFVMEGPAWENNKVAFRNYYDARNGMDIFGKRTEKMVLDNVGHEGSNYHQLESWGMDILKVGTSLGAGAIAIKTRDTIFRVGSPSKSSYKLIADGPLKGVFELDHKNWLESGNNYNINQQISIAANNLYYESIITATGVREGDQLVTGIVNLNSDSLYVYENVGDYVILATHDKQAEDGAKLGMALVIKKKDFIGVMKNPLTKDISSTYFAAVHLSNNTPVKYRFYAGWETQDKSFAQLNGFMTKIRKDIYTIRHPLQVSVKRIEK